MVPAVRVVTIAFHLLRRNGQPPTVLASSRVDPAVGHSNFRRITIRHIAAGFRGIVRHVPRRIELFVQCQLLCSCACAPMEQGMSSAMIGRMAVSV
jgi:hypothetical protein